MVASPQSVRVNKSTGAGMEIDWKDGHRSAYTFAFLREACPCATCEDEREKHPAKPAALLPLYKEPVRPTEVEQVGNYAISFVWNDGHRAGIFTWDFLRAICPCAACAAERLKAENPATP